MTGRRNLVMLVAAAIVVSSLSTWVAAQRIQSPAEAAARTAPPTPSPILAPVVERVLTTKVVTRGTAHYGSPRTLSVVPSGLKTGAQVVTTLPRPGSVLRSGDELLTVSGRPVFLLDGAQPAYRDLGPGMSGADVQQLERALAGAGLEPGAVDGVYDAATEAAVTGLYERHGYAPLRADAAALDRARPAEAGLVEGALAGPGVQLPSDEVVFVRSTPLRVTDLPASVGEAPDGALVTVTDSAVVIDGLLPTEQADRVRRGARVLIDEPALGIDTQGRVVRVAARPGTGGADTFHVAFEVAVDKVVPGLVGSSVRLTVPIRSTKTARLTVPLSAVSLGPDGEARVQLRSGDGGLTTVPVETGLSSDGLISVSAADGLLTAGDRVVIGFQRRLQAGASR